MDTRLRFVLGNEEYAVCRWFEVQADRQSQTLSRGVALRVAEQLYARGSHDGRFRALLHGGLRLLPGHQANDAHILSRLGPALGWQLVVEALRTGKLVFLRQPLPKSRLPLSNPDELPPPAAPQTTVTDWIEIVVQYDDGSPYEGPYRLQLADGSLFEDTLTRGRARHDGIKPGQCKVSFPELDGKSWRKV